MESVRCSHGPYSLVEVNKIESKCCVTCKCRHLERLLDNSASRNSHLLENGQGHNVQWEWTRLISTKGCFLQTGRSSSFTLLKGRDDWPFLDAGRIRGQGLTVELGLEVLSTGSLVRRATSINLEKDVKDKFSKKILYSSDIEWRRISTSTSSATGLQVRKEIRGRYGTF